MIGRSNIQLPGFETEVSGAEHKGGASHFWCLK